MKFSKRLDKIPPYLFATLDKMKNEKIKQGMKIISLGIGDPDVPTAPLVIDAMKKAIDNPSNHRYPDYGGSNRFKSSIADFYKRRFGVTLDPNKEVNSLIGSKEGIAHLSLAVLDPGDLLLVPDPGYPVYRISANFAGADTYTMPLLKENNFLPDFTKIPEDVARRAKMMFINYPNNPTSAHADIDFFKEAVDFAKKYDIIIASDNAYSEIFYDGIMPPSILSIPGAKDVAAEFFSLSKPYNMTGWRVGAVVGNEHIVEALGRFKQNLDSGVFTAIDETAAYALDNGDEFVAEMREIYKRRRDKICKSLSSMGIEVVPPKTTFYLWLPTPAGMKSFDFTVDLLNRAGVLVTPGTGFGEYGEGYFRISLTTPDDQIDEAVERLKSLSYTHV